MLAGATERAIGDGNSPWNEAFGFATVEEYRAFARVRPDLFDRQLDARERARRWREFAQTSVGRAMRWR